MNYFRVLCNLDDRFAQLGRRYAVVGAFALHAYGLTRATADLDLVTEEEGKAELLAFLAELGYEVIHLSEGYSNHVHSEGAMGRVNVIYVGGPTAEQLFAGVRRTLAFRDRRFPVPRPEHLAAMKAFAVRNAPERALQDLADVQRLLTLPDVDREEVRGYFDRYGLSQRFAEIEEALRHRGS